MMEISTLLYIVRLMLADHRAKMIRYEWEMWNDREVWATSTHYLIIQSCREAYDPTSNYLMALVAEKPKYKDERTREALKNSGFLASRWNRGFLFSKYGKDMVMATVFPEIKHHYDCLKDWIPVQDIFDLSKNLDDDDVVDFDKFFSALIRENDPSIKEVENHRIQIKKLRKRNEVSDGN